MFCEGEANIRTLGRSLANFDFSFTFIFALIRNDGHRGGERLVIDIAVSANSPEFTSPSTYVIDSLGIY